MEEKDYYSSKEFKDMLMAFEECMSSGNHIYMDLDDLIDLTEYYHEKGKPQKALAASDYALQLYPEGTMALLTRAHLALLEEGDADKAEEFLSKVTDTDEQEYIYTCAEIKLFRGNDKGADKLLEEHKCEYIGTDEWNDYCIDSAMIFIDYQYNEFAQKWLDMAEADEDDSYFVEARGRLAAVMGKVEQSEDDYNRLIDRDPFSTFYWNGLAVAQINGGKLSESIASCEYALAINPDDKDALQNKGAALYRLGELDDALKCFQKYITLCPDDANGELSVGSILVSLNRHKEGVAHLHKAERIAVNKNDEEILADIYIQLAFGNMQMEHMDEAFGYLNRLDTLPGTDKNDTMVMRGYFHLHNGMEEETVQCFENAIRSSHCSPVICQHIIIAFIDEEYYKSAYAFIKSITNIFKTDWKIIYPYLALCCYQLGKNEEFIDTLQKSVIADPEQTKNILGDIFPKNLNPEDYIYYFKNK